MVQSTSSGLPTKSFDFSAPVANSLCLSFSLLICGADLEQADTALLRGVALPFLSADEAPLLCFVPLVSFAPVSFSVVSSPALTASAEGLLGDLPDVEVA